MPCPDHVPRHYNCLSSRTRAPLFGKSGGAAEVSAVSAHKDKVVSKDEWMRLYAMSRSRATSLHYNIDE